MRWNSRAWVSAAGAITIALAACDGGVELPGTGGSGGALATGGGSSVSTSSSSASTSSSSSTGGGSACADAPWVDIGSSVDGDLAVTGQKDYYRFAGTQGQVLYIDIDAQFFNDAEYDPEHIDSVVTLVKADGTKIARNNDPIEYGTNDSRLYTILPEDGEYCVRVAECWTDVSDPTENCQAPQDKSFTTYTLYVRELVDKLTDPETADEEAGDDAASATTITYDTDSSGDYVASSIWGTFRDDVDVDVFSFTMPPAFGPVPAGRRADGTFYVMQSGVNGSGSTAPTGRISVVDPAAPEVPIAALDATKNSLFIAPLELGKKYWLFVTRPAGAIGANDFYFLRQHLGWGNQLETEIGFGANDTVATAEATVPDSDVSYTYVEGDLTSAPQDVDYYLVNVPADPNLKSVRATCFAWVLGSGLRSLKVGLRTADDMPLPGSAGMFTTEVEDRRAYTSVTPLNEAAQVFLRVEAASQDPMVSSAYYRCVVRFLP